MGGLRREGLPVTMGGVRFLGRSRGAATGNPGTSLCRREDVFGLFEKAGGTAPAARA